MDHNTIIINIVGKVADTESSKIKVLLDGYIENKNLRTWIEEYIITIKKHSFI